MGLLVLQAHRQHEAQLVISCLVVMGSCAKLPLEEREEPIAILRSESFKDGANFNYNFEAENGIAVDTVGSSNGAGASNMQGSYRYILDDGSTANFNWIADEEGYRVESNMLPVAPAFPHPIPAYVQEQIDFAAAPQAAGLTWDQEQGAWIRV